MAGINVVYNSTSLQTNNLIVNNIQHDPLPSKAQNVYPLARANRSVITNYQYPSKRISIEGQIIGTSLTDLETRIDAFKLAMTPTGNSGNLDIDYNGSVRRYVATVDDGLMVTRSEALFKAAFSLPFICVDPWGRDTANTTLISSATITTATSSQAITVGGTSPEQYLVITATINSLTSTDAVNTITLENLTTGQKVNITRLWAAADVLVVDVFNETVKVNGVDVEWSGVPPVFPTGSQTLKWTDDFSTARNVSLNVVQLKRYL